MPLGCSWRRRPASILEQLLLYSRSWVRQSSSREFRYPRCCAHIPCQRCAPHLASIRGALLYRAADVLTGFLCAPIMATCTALEGGWKGCMENQAGRGSSIWGMLGGILGKTILHGAACQKSALLCTEPSVALSGGVKQ